MRSSTPELEAAWEKHGEAQAESWLIQTVSTEPLVVAASGVDQRGTIYAAYALADLIRAKADLSQLDRFHQPRVGLRFVSFGATTHGRREYRPELYWQTLNELPSFGYNGVIIYPGGGTPVGRRVSPISETETGELFIDAETAPQWQKLYDAIDRYGLDIMMTIPPAVPPGYSDKQIRDFYAGGTEPEGYLDALRTHFARYVELQKQACPQADYFMCNSTEGATFGRSARFFTRPSDRSSLDDYRSNNERVMQAYLDVLLENFPGEESKLMFWTHSFGLTSDGIASMRKVLFQYPEMTIIEDDFWNNNLWPHDLPAMAYLPPDLRAEISQRNPFALFQIATDGEYYGGGSLPNAYPGSHIRSANEALERNARLVIQRLDLHDRTPYGTACGTMEIVPLAASQQLWEPTPGEPEIWREWSESRFGKDAAPLVVEALQESHSVLIDGLSCNGIDLLGVGSEFAPRLWMRSENGLSRFHLFGRPGELFVKKEAGDVIYSEEYTAWQMKTRSIAIDEYRANQAKAQAAVDRGLEKIEQAKPLLRKEDYEMLAGIFTNGRHVLQATRLLGESAYAANLVLDNFDNVGDPQAQFEESAKRLEALIASEKLIAPMNRNLSQIIASYRKLVMEHPPTSAG